MRGQRLLVIFSLFSGFGLLAQPAIVRGESATEAVDRLEKKAVGVNSLYMATRNMSEEDKTKKQSSLKIWRKKAGDKWKSRVVSTPESQDKDQKPTVTVSDGQTEWREIQLGDKPMAFKSKASSNTPNDFAEIKSRLKMGEGKIKDKEKVEGHSCVVIEITGTENGNRFQASYWISEEHGLVLRNKFERADRTKSESIATEVKVNDNISDSEFAYTPSAGVTVVDTDAMGGTPAGGEKKKGD